MVERSLGPCRGFGVGVLRDEANPCAEEPAIARAWRFEERPTLSSLIERRAEAGRLLLAMVRNAVVNGQVQANDFRAAS
jgi:hypothetical protein